MAYNYKVYGPYKVNTEPVTNSYLRLCSAQRELWNTIKKENDDLKMREMKGIYIFSNSKKTPIYVGKTDCKFGGECFTEHKRELINEYLRENRIGCNQIIYITFICFTPPNKKLLKKDKEKLSYEIDNMETYYIQKAKNKKLLNTRKVTPSWKLQDENNTLEQLKLVK